MFLANAKSNFAAIFWLFYGIFRISGKNGVFPMRIGSEKLRFLLYEFGQCLFAFEKHLYTYSIQIISLQKLGSVKK
jgi:hypothetical protein